MKVILLSAGLGKRLRPFTLKRPKCLMPIKGVPLLQFWLDKLTEDGFGPFLINTHYFQDQVEDFIEENSFNNKVTLSYEPELLGTAGTLIKHIDFFDSEDGMLIHADNYCLANFNDFYQAHKNRPSNCLMTMMVFRTDTPTTCGIVELDNNNVVVDFHEKVENPPDNLANGAIYIISNELLKSLQLRDSIEDFSTEILPELIGKIYTYETSKVFIDIGSPEAYEKANQL